MALYFDLSTPATEPKTGAYTRQWGRWIQDLFGQMDSLTTEVDTLATVVNGLPGVNRKTYAELNALGLGASDEGYLAFEYTYNHFVRWTGATWQFFGGDVGNKFRRDFMGAPQELGWQLCDGTVTDYLTLGATLTVTAVTTPNLTGTPSFHKSIAAYTGALEAAIAPSLSGSTGSAGTTVSGTTGTESAHTHGVTLTLGAATVTNNASAGLDFGAANALHLHSASGTSDAGSAHSHGVGSLSADAHTHGVGSLAANSAARPPSIGWLPYFRR